MEFKKNSYKKQASAEEIDRKIRHYCAYQERSHYEVREKLYSLGLHQAQVEKALTQLIEDDYLNEERFARRFVSGRFSLKKWGRVKIKYELKLKRVSEYNIKIGLKEIEEARYAAVLKKLLEDKWLALKQEQPVARQAKAMAYLQQKGYEPALVLQAIKAMKENGG